MAGYSSFREFYPFYLGEHRDRTCRRLHFAGTSGALGCIAAAIVRDNAWWLLGALVCGYAFAWVGHFFFEKNRPATFKHRTSIRRMWIYTTGNSSQSFRLPS